MVGFMREQTEWLPLCQHVRALKPSLHTDVWPWLSFTPCEGPGQYVFCVVSGYPSGNRGEQGTGARGTAPNSFTVKLNTKRSDQIRYRLSTQAGLVAFCPAVSPGDKASHSPSPSIFNLKFRKQLLGCSQLQSACVVTSERDEKPYKKSSTFNQANLLCPLTSLWGVQLKYHLPAD